jgi:DNA-directed RNA polymerase alpha subunit
LDPGKSKENFLISAFKNKFQKPIMTSYTLLSCIDSRVENLTKFYGRFELGPFAPGQALTVANALRRALLSQLSGTSITLVEIQGASNEYEILNGVRESVLDILLNLKQIILTSDFEILSPQIGFLSVKGPGIVRASDLKLPPFIYTVDPSQYIATLSNSGRLNMKFVICSGKNYITYNPSDSRVLKWVELLKTAVPLNELINKNELPKLNSQNPSSKIISTVKPQTLKGSEMLSLKNALVFVEKKVDNQEKPKKDDFYKQWLNERASLSNPTSKNLKSASLPNQSSKKLENASNFDQEFNDPWAEVFPERLKNANPLRNPNLEAVGEPRPLSFFDSRRPKPPFSVVMLKVEENDEKLKTSSLGLNQASSIPTPSPRIGYFPIDAVFMPVNRVNYLIEPTENFKTPQERLILEVWTNGSIHPRHAIHKAAKYLIQLFLPFQQMRSLDFQTSLKPLTFLPQEDLKKNSEKFKEYKTKTVIKSQKKMLKKSDLDRVLELDIGNLNLTARPYSCLKMANINTIQELASYSKKDLLLIKNFGQRSLLEVEKALQKINVNLK